MTNNRPPAERGEARPPTGWSAICQRILRGGATVEDAYAFIEAELREADSCLEPSAPKNGRVIDGWHASACVIRALSVLGRMKRGEFAALAAPAAQPETWCSPENRVGNPALEGCTGNGRPSCTAAECFYGIETCPVCKHPKGIGSKCNFKHVAAPAAQPEWKAGDRVMCSGGPTYLRGRVGTVVGPKLIARADIPGWDDLGVIAVDFGTITGVGGNVTHESHYSNFVAAPAAGEAQPPCANGIHEWSNQFGDDWTPEKGTLCDCRQRQWGVAAAG